MPTLAMALAAPLAAGCSRPSVPVEPTQGISLASPRATARLTAKQGEEADGLELRKLVAQPLSWQEPSAQSGARRHIKVLGFNDLHGQLLGRQVDGRPAGGAAVLTAYLREAARGFEHATLITYAGDLMGASPPYAALLQDEPGVTFFNMLGNAACHSSDRANAFCNVVATVGNHEFDEGTAELLRMVRGGNHQNGPFLGVDYQGPNFPYIGANVIDVVSGRPLLSPYIEKTIGGSHVGCVGAVLKDAPTFLIASSIRGLRFEDEVRHINNSVSELKTRGIRAIVVVIHQGGSQVFGPGVPRDQSSVSGAIRDIVGQLDPEVDLVVTGHTHSPLLALLPNAGGRPTLVTQAFHSSTAFANIDLELDPTTGDVVAKSARLVTTFADSGPGLLPDLRVAAYVDSVVGSVQARTARVVGEAPVDLTRKLDRAGQSAIGNLLADAQRAATGTELAFITPAWLRADLRKGQLTWGDLFAAQPFGNRLMKVELSGQQVRRLLNQQWLDETYNRVLCVSGLSYTWDGRRAANDRILEVHVGGNLLEPNRRYSATVNEFLAEGGERYSVFADLHRSDTGIGDLEALVRWADSHPQLSSSTDGRIRRKD